jgi:Ni/Fe-hydrogenase 1 B-type cytochrome subunit
MADSRPVPVAKERIYVWQLPVRVAHWVIFFSVLILSASGYYIGHPFISVPGPAKEHFVMGTVRAIHLYTAIVFTLAVLVRVFYWSFAGNRYARLTELILLSPRRWHSFGKTFLYYLFLRRHPDVYLGHDGLAGATYGLIFAIYLVLIVTGLALYTVYAPVDSPFQVFRFLVQVFNGLQVARLIHHICMWVVLIFAIIHIYSAVLWSLIEDSGEMDSIFTGYKFWPKGKADTA